MKEDINIEELFQEHFKSFEGDVSPDAWSNIQQSVQTGAGTSSGMPTWVKGLLIGTGISAAVVGGVYLSTDDQTENTSNDELVELSTEESMDVAEHTLVVDNVESNETVVEQNNVVDANHQIENQGTIDYANDLQSDLVDRSEVDDNGTNASNNDGSIQNDLGATNNDGETDINNDLNNDEDVNQKPDTGNDEEDVEDVADQIKPAGSLSFEKGLKANYTRYKFTSNAQNHTNVNWDFGDGKTAEGDNISHTYQQPGDYIVTMTVNGREGVYVETIELNIVAPSNIGVIPNIFSPNNDGNNDLFIIQTTEIDKFVLLIQDKNGQVVFETTDPDFEWDGTNQANIPVPSGYYNIVIKAVGTDGRDFIEGGVLRVVTE